MANALILIWPGISVLSVSVATIIIAFADELTLYRWVGPVLMAVGYIGFGIHYVILNLRISRLPDLKQGKWRATASDERSRVKKFGDLHQHILRTMADRRTKGRKVDHKTSRLEIELFAELERLGINRPLNTTNAALLDYWEYLAFLSQDATSASLNEARNKNLIPLKQVSFKVQNCPQ